MLHFTLRIEKKITIFSFHKFHKMKAYMWDVIHPPVSYRPKSNKWMDIHNIYYQDQVLRSFVFCKYLVINSQADRLSAYQGGMCSTSYFQFKFIPPLGSSAFSPDLSGLQLIWATLLKSAVWTAHPVATPNMPSTIRRLPLRRQRRGRLRPE
jgi:hypothetical protein